MHKARVHTWDGSSWSYTSDWYTADDKILKPIIKTSAEKYAGEKKFPVRDCAKES